MADMKTEFRLVWTTGAEVADSMVKICTGIKHKNRVMVSIGSYSQPMYLKDKDLERFAVNILKALNSKHLKSKKWVSGLNP